VAQVPRFNEISRLDLVRQSLIDRGFSKKVAKRTSMPQRESTAKSYEHIWGKFVCWLDSRGTPDPTKVSVQVLVSYLDTLRHDGKAVSTIKAYKSCIVKTIFQLTGLCLLESGAVSDYLKNLSQEVPKERLKFPKWELCVVLRGLTCKPFEPLEQVDIRALTLKTVFLIALASAARVGELAALSAQEGYIRVKEDKSKVTLCPFQAFLAKNQRGSDPPREYAIKALHPHVPDDDPERLLCPVRAIRLYLKRTNKTRGNRKKLFLSLSPKSTSEIGANTISRWLRDTIKLTYQSQNSSEIQKLLQVSAHEVRAIATSLVAWKNVSIHDIMKAAYWRNHNTFTGFYLRDMTASTGKLQRSEGTSVVCAGKELVLDL
jgi:hypothetical protein